MRGAAPGLGREIRAHHHAVFGDLGHEIVADDFHAEPRRIQSRVWELPGLSCPRRCGQSAGPPHHPVQIQIFAPPFRQRPQKKSYLSAPSTCRSERDCRRRSGGSSARMPLVTATMDSLIMGCSDRATCREAQVQGLAIGLLEPVSFHMGEGKARSGPQGPGMVV